MDDRVALSNWRHLRVVLEGASRLSASRDVERGAEGSLFAADRRVRGAHRGEEPRGVRERLAKSDRARHLQSMDREDERSARALEYGAVSAAPGDGVRAPFARA